MKKILAKTPKGEYYINLKIVAENRANYYADVDFVEIGGLEWQEERDFVMENNYEGIDWLLNNMDWEDVEDDAEKISDRILVTEENFWRDSDHFEIIEV